MRKFLNAACLAADLAPGITLAIAGVAVMLGGVTGVLWC
jgi:hypothetical protein